MLLDWVCQREGYVPTTYTPCYQFTHRRTTEIKVDFVGRQPRDPLVLVMKMNEKKYETEFGGGDEVRWSGNV